MDDLSQTLNQILSDPNSMAQIQNIMGSLGLGAQNTPSAPQNALPAPAAPAQNAGQSPTAALAPLLSALGGQGGGGGDMGGMISTIAKVAPFLSKAQEEDDSARLLLALKPMLSEARRKKIDESLRILQLMKLLPLLKDAGVLSSLLGGIL